MGSYPIDWIIITALRLLRSTRTHFQCKTDVYCPPVAGFFSALESYLPSSGLTIKILFLANLVIVKLKIFINSDK